MRDHEKAFCDASNKTIERLEALIDSIHDFHSHRHDGHDEIVNDLERIVADHRQAHNTFVFACANMSEFRA